ncbi:hypothetical protein MSL71_7930 [Desulfoluna butyratoxydans]|uniref:Uncharacterized protein n=1 Tax=Desulfoluna butyratoxydans TaxID=231438 RepID=A0A4U8YHT0_9BACT|nr:hypothetical protein MSL71_7930 [Desulfoluna butyratoxydans]
MPALKKESLVICLPWRMESEGGGGNVVSKGMAKGSANLKFVLFYLGLY